MDIKIGQNKKFTTKYIINKFDYADLRILNTKTIYIKGIPKQLAKKRILTLPQFLS